MTVSFTFAATDVKAKAKLNWQMFFLKLLANVVLPLKRVVRVGGG